jgi:hypothetical protein
MNDAPRTNPAEFSLMAGGPFYELSRRLGLVTATQTLRVWRIAIVMWLPIAVGTVGRLLVGWKLDPFVFDISVHTRFLVSLPLVVLAGHLIDGQSRSATIQLFDGKFADRSVLEDIFDRARRLRDNGWVECIFAVLALLGGQLTLWGVMGPTGVIHGVDTSDDSVARIYYSGLALPLLQFLTLRWLWRWGIWSYIMLRVSRLPLKTIATHPDKAAGLGFLSAPVTGFAVFEMGLASLLSAAWGTQLLDGRVTVPSLLPTLMLFVLLSSALACTPMVPFMGHLYRAKRRALLAYNPLALEYMRGFHRKWVDPRPSTEEDLLGTPDIQSLADIGNAYKVMTDTRTFLFGKKKLAEIWLAAVVPMVPLIVTVIPVNELFKRIGGALIGGLFG